MFIRQSENEISVWLIMENSKIKVNAVMAMCVKPPQNLGKLNSDNCLMFTSSFTGPRMVLIYGSNICFLLIVYICAENIKHGEMVENKVIFCSLTTSSIWLL